MMHRHFKHAAIAAAVLSTFNVHAVDETELGQVVVTATRTPSRVSTVLSDVTVLDRQDIEQSPVTSLSELLATLPGITLTTTGGRGANSSMFIRGANANHSLVLVDGQRISSATTGTTSIEHIPLEQIERIEVLRGPASSLYGADAIGGVIQIFTRKPGTGKPVPEFSVGVGSYGTNLGSLGYGGQAGDTRFNVSAGWENSRNFSSVKGPGGTFSDMFNADRDPYTNKNISAHVSQSLSASTEIGGDYLEARTNKHFDAANCDVFFTTCTPNFDNRQNQNLRSYSGFAATKISDSWKSTLRLGHSDDDTTSLHLDPVAALVAADRFNTGQDQVSWQNDFTTAIGHIMAAAEWRKEKVDSTQTFVVKDRTTRALVLGYQGQFDRHELQASARVDDIQRMGSHNSGLFAYGYRIDDSLSAHFSVGRAFHAPTFNDLYWPVDPINFYQGNPSLRPERAFNQEVGIRYVTAKTLANFTVFHNKVTDLMNYVPSFVFPFTGQYVNLSSATLKGASASYQLNTDTWTWRANMDVLSARDDASGLFLQRRVPRSALLEAHRPFGQLDFGVQLSATSHRFNDTGNTQTLGGYSLLNLNAAYHVTPEWTLQAKVGNLFDRDYVVVKDAFTQNVFNTPGRNLFVGVRYQPK